jgi:phosphoglycolate phosphatase
LRGFVGLRLAAIFSSLLGADDEGLVDRAVGIYRPLFDEEGLLHSRVFPGIPEALAGLRESGHALQVVTVRSIHSARLVVRHFDLEPYFDAVHGPQPADRACDKAHLVRAALTLAGARADQTVMIGDRADDIRAARAHGVRAVAVGWGYGAAGELAAEKPDYLAATVPDLLNWLAASPVSSL